MFRIGRLIPNFLFEGLFNFLAFAALIPIVLNRSHYSPGTLLSIIILIGDRLNILDLPFMQSLMSIWLATENPHEKNVDLRLITMLDNNPLQEILDTKNISLTLVPDQFICPISREIICKSAKIAGDSHHWFSMDFLLASLKVNSINPMTREKISEKDVIRDAWHDYAICLFVNYLLLNQERLQSLPVKDAIAETEVFAEKAKQIFSEQNIKTLFYTSSFLFKKYDSQHTFFVSSRLSHTNAKINPTKNIADFMEKHDSCYAVLGLAPNCDTKQIQHQYYALAKKYHPDKNQHDGDKFQLMSTAKAILLDPKQRAIHDKLLPRPRQQFKM